MTEPRIQRIRDGLAARQAFGADALIPWIVTGQHVGWLSRERALLLARWPHWFDVSTQRIGPQETVTTEAQRITALAGVIIHLAEEGHVRGWRDERFAVNTGWDTPTSALIERAIIRFFGIRTYAARIDGLVVGAGSTGPVLWLARHAETKPIDPGMWDNLVAGSIGHGFDVRDALEKEYWKEADIDADLIAQLASRDTLDVLREIPEDIQCKTLFTPDLTLPNSFILVSQDGEVAGHLRASPNTTLDIMASFTMTVDATLVTLDALARLSSTLAPQGFAPGNTV